MFFECVIEGIFFYFSNLKRYKRQATNYSDNITSMNNNASNSTISNNFSLPDSLEERKETNSSGSGNNKLSRHNQCEGNV